MLAGFRSSCRLWGAAAVGALLGLALSPLVIGTALQPAHSAGDDTPICKWEDGSAKPGEAPYLAEDRAAMAKMMAAMSIEPSGDVDHDFVKTMVPHHQGAIEMAIAVLRHGKNEQLRRIAQEIIVTQQQEIAAMRFALGEPLPADSPNGTEVLAQPSGPGLPTNGK